MEKQPGIILAASKTQISVFEAKGKDNFSCRLRQKMTSDFPIAGISLSDQFVFTWFEQSNKFSVHKIEEIIGHITEIDLIDIQN